MQLSELQIYAKSGLIQSAIAMQCIDEKHYTLVIEVSIHGKQSSKFLHTARNQVRLFKSLDTLVNLFNNLPHSQIPLLYVERKPT